MGVSAPSGWDVRLWLLPGGGALSRGGGLGMFMATRRGLEDREGAWREKWMASGVLVGWVAACDLAAKPGSPLNW